MNLIKKIIKFYLTKEFFYYFLVGLLGAVVDFGSFGLLVNFGTSILVAQWFAGLLGFTHNHLWYHFRVFKHNQKKNKTYVLSLVVNIATIIISGPLLLLLNHYISNVWVNKFLMSGCFALFTFLFRKKFIFILKK